MAGSSPPEVDTAGVAALRDWMIGGARPSARAADIIPQMCERLLAAGVPVGRFALFFFTLHPNIRGRSYVWRPGSELFVGDADLTLAATDGFKKSIAVHVMNTGASYRCRFTTGEALPPFSDVIAIRDEGMTDYLIEPLVYTTGETHAASWATAQPNGFTDDQIAALESIRAPLARLTEIYMLRLNAANLLSAYVGRDGGRKVLEGNVNRGDTEQISAAILFVDIKGFTSFSDSTPAPDVIRALNDFFEVFVTAVDEEGGEVLKFIGDALLGIFPVDPARGADGEAAAVASAAASLRRAEALFAETPGPHSGFRAAIHCGEISYGNIGGGDRLDFTAIGPAVNLAARLLGVASDTGRDIVCSHRAAAHLPKSEPLGAFSLKGIAAAQQVHALSPPEKPVA